MVNDFTKKELKKFLSLIRGESRKLSIEQSFELVSKLQFLINNYDAKVIEAWHCEKCGHVQ
jgi:hypothetical protein